VAPREPPPLPPDRANLWRQIGEYTGLAIMLPAAGLVGYAIGYALDRALGTGQIFKVVFLMLGCAAGLIEIVRVAGRK